MKLNHKNWKKKTLIVIKIIKKNKIKNNKLKNLKKKNKNLNQNNKILKNSKKRYLKSYLVIILQSLNIF